MIAIDTSSMRRYLSGEEGPDVVLVVTAMRSRRAALPPVVVTELLSEPTMAERTMAALAKIRRLQLREGYWERAGALRRTLKREGWKARLADCLVAQACIDSEVPLVSYDRDFRHFTAQGLVLLHS